MTFLKKKMCMSGHLEVVKLLLLLLLDRDVNIYTHKYVALRCKSINGHL